MLFISTHTFQVQGIYPQNIIIEQVMNQRTRAGDIGGAGSVEIVKIQLSCEILKKKIRAEQHFQYSLA